MEKKTDRNPYSTDLSDQEWKVLEPLIPAAKPGGRSRRVNMREILNAIIYRARTGCAWELLPHDFPPYQTVYDYFNKWSQEGSKPPTKPAPTMPSPITVLARLRIPCEARITTWRCFLVSLQALKSEHISISKAQAKALKKSAT